MDLKAIAVLLVCGLAIINAERIHEDDNRTNAKTYENINKQYENELYNTLLSRDYDAAVKRTLVLYGTDYKQVISNTVNRMIDNGLPELFDFAFKVTETKATFVIRDCFPPEIRFYNDMVFSKIISQTYNMALLCGTHVDWYGDRPVYANSDTSTRFQISWKFIPIWYDDRLYFKIRSVDVPAYLKLGESRDWAWDYTAYAAKSSDTNRHLWYLKPTKHNGKLLYYIINREFDKPLKLGKSVDGDGERQLYGHSELNYTEERLLWDIQAL